MRLEQVTAWCATIASALIDIYLKLVLLHNSTAPRVGEGRADGQTKFVAFARP